MKSLAVSANLNFGCRDDSMATSKELPVRINEAVLHFLQIPFRVSVSHGGRTQRTSSDSLILALSSDGGKGYGEAVVRDYVSGSLGEGADFEREAARIASSLIEPFREKDLSAAEAATSLAVLPCDARALPLVCAMESALLDLASREEKRDVYQLLGMEPVRAVVRFGAVIPFLPLEHARMYLQTCEAYGFPDVKVKLGQDKEYNATFLELCRTSLGDGCDIRVDANGAWAVEDAEHYMALCARCGVRIIEQPFSVSAPGASEALAQMAGRGFKLMADEAVLTGVDVRETARTGCYQILNLRLSKNGGLSRVLALAREADAAGLSYQLGCMVGETGVLSALGRVAASLLPRPLYLEGGYDDVLLKENITTRNFGFGPGGSADVVRGNGNGYTVDEEKLARLTRSRVPV
jgi:L-Ala-D/L-Glu epimerase